MKHFYSFSLVNNATCSTQLLCAQQTTLAGNDVSLLASGVAFNNPGISLTQSTGFFTESNPGNSLTTKKEKDIFTTAQYNGAVFRIFPDNGGNDFKAGFIASKSGKAILQIKSISGQVIYKENI